MTNQATDSTAGKVFVSSEICGTGYSVPDRIVDNNFFASYLETSDDWIRERTGIVQRRWAEEDASTSEVAEPACRDAIKAAGLDVQDIDAILVATVTPDYIFPSTACMLQKRLGIKKCFATDINAVCSGFVYAFVMADSLIRNAQAENILVVGADLYSRIIDKEDRGTCVLFGDGAGAVVLSKKSGATSKLLNAPLGIEGSIGSTSGVYHSELCADGSLSEILCACAGTAKPVTAESIQKREHFIKMAGREVFKHAVRSLGDINLKVIEAAGLSADDIDHFVSHQANKRILLSMAKQLNVPESKIPMNVEKFGNTSAASIPILLGEFVENGSIKKGDLMVMSAFGGGVTWGATLVRY